MGKIYIKQEDGKKVLYEENTSPFPFGDKKLGELHKNWDGSLETRNASGENYKLTEEKDFLDFIPIPGARPHNYEVETSSGKSGKFEWDSCKDRYELKEELTTKYPTSYSSNNHSPNRGDLYSTHPATASGHSRAYSSQTSPTQEREDVTQSASEVLTSLGVLGIAGVLFGFVVADYIEKNPEVKEGLKKIFSDVFDLFKNVLANRTATKNKGKAI